MVYVHLADGFEEIEALTILDVLRRAGVPAQSVSIMESKRVTGAHEIAVEADLMFDEAVYDSCDMLVLPGGGPGTQRLAAHEGLKQQLLQFAGQDKWIAAICAAPLLLAQYGLLDDREATIYQGMEDHLKRARYRKAAVVESGKIITSRGPATAMAFALALAEKLAGAEKAAQVRAALLYEG